MTNGLVYLILFNCTTMHMFEKERSRKKYRTKNNRPKYRIHVKIRFFDVYKIIESILGIHIPSCYYSMYNCEIDNGYNRFLKRLNCVLYIPFIQFNPVILYRNLHKTKHGTIIILIFDIFNGHFFCLEILTKRFRIYCQRTT